MKREVIAVLAAFAIATIAGWVAASPDRSQDALQRAERWRLPEAAPETAPEPIEWARAFGVMPSPEEIAAENQGRRRTDTRRIVALIDTGESPYLLVNDPRGGLLRLRSGDRVGDDGWRLLTFERSSVEFEREGETRIFSVFGAERRALEEFLDGELRCPQGEECA